MGNDNVQNVLRDIEYYMKDADDFQNYYNTHYAVVSKHFINAYSKTPKDFAIQLLKFFGVQIKDKSVISINFNCEIHKHLAAIYAFVEFLNSQNKTFSFNDSILKKLVNEN